MKFRDPKFGTEYQTIGEALAAYMCPGPCGDCVLTAYRMGQDCETWAKKHPNEAAALMGYEVVKEMREEMREPQLNAGEKEANMDKPLKDWTLGEVKDYCSGHDCGDCKLFQNPECFLSGNPSKWRTEEKPRFTEQEVEAAKAIKTLFPCAVSVKRLDLSIRVQDRDEVLIVQLSNSLFRSIQLGETYTLDEVIGGAE